MQSLTNPTYNIILQLIRSSLYGEEFVLSNQEAIDWHKIYRELEQQTISCVVVDVLSDSQCNIPTKLRDAWMNRLGLNISAFHRILTFQDEAVCALREKEIPTAVLKGAISASHYPKPEYRAMGDIDLLVPAECFEEARQTILDLGYRFEDEAKGELDSRSKQKHLAMVKDGVILELHIRAFTLPDKNANKLLNQSIIDGLQDIRYFSLHDYEIPTLPMIPNAIELLIHVQEHFCGTGIGMRQVIDWMMFAREHLRDSIYEQEFLSILQRTGMEKFACTLTRMCQLYLGLPEEDMHWCMDVDEALCGQMLEYIFQQGNFGYKNKNDSGARALARLRHPMEFLKNIQGVGLSYHPELRNKKILRYFAWVPQLGRYIRYVFSKDTNLREDYKAGKQRSDMFESLELFKAQVSQEPVEGNLLIGLVRDVLHREKVSDVIASWTETQIQRVIEYASDQGLYMFLQENPIFREHLQQEKNLKKTMSSVYLYTLQTEELKRILDLFEERHIHCLILKGSRSRAFYPKAELRSMGDIDLLYKPEQTKAVQQAMYDLGYRGEGDTAKHDHYVKKMVSVEMHKALCIPEWRESQYFETIWERVCLKDGCQYVNEMTLEDHYLYTFTHLLEHFRMGGIGVRMVLDIYILLQIKEIDWTYVDDVLQKLDYQEFHSNLRRLAEAWFGKESAGYVPYEFKELADYIMQGGVFGNIENDRMNVQLQYKGKTHFLRTVIFPKYKTMQSVYPWLKTRFLLPFAWGLRCVQAALRRRGNVKNQFRRAQAFGGSQKALEMRKQFFDRVGLR